MEYINNKPSEEILKDLFYNFGLAYYHSECLCRQLCIMYAVCSFRSLDDATRSRYEEKLTYAFSLTMGKIFEEVKGMIHKEIHVKIEEAIKKRNFIAHDFWYEKAHMLFSMENVQKLIDDLNDCANLFNEIDEILCNIFRPIQKKVEIKFKINFDREIEKVKSGKPPEPLLKKRKLKKKEKIINVYSVPPNNALVFQTDDFELWSLCDIGLVWSNLTKPEDNWTINEKIQKYLPVEINPRPQIIEPWNYDFNLSHDKILHIKKENNMIRYGIKQLLNKKGIKK